MAVKFKTVVDLTDDIAKAASSLSGKKVSVGVMSGEHQWLAGIHEYGCIIPVTPKMRAYLHRIGVHLKKSTTKIVIPERSFLRAGYDQNRDAITRKASRLLGDVMGGTMSEDQFFEIFGTEFREAIKDYAIELSDPPKQEWPTRDPSKNNPLVMSGDMIGGIEYEVE